MRFIATGLQVIALLLTCVALVIQLLASFIGDALIHTGDWLMRAAVRVAQAATK